MTSPALIRESDARRLAKVAREMNCAVTVDKDGNITFTPLPDEKKKPVAWSGEIRL